MTRTRGKFYATGTARRDNGKRYGTEVARQARTVEEARERLSAAVAAGRVERGYVQRWDDRTQQRYIVCELDEAGNWTATDPITGNVRFIP